MQRDIIRNGLKCTIRAKEALEGRPGQEKGGTALLRRGRDDGRLARLSPELQDTVDALFAWEGEEFTLDFTGLLTYAVMKNPRCLKALRAYMEGHGKACYEAYRRSAYVDIPLLEWFSGQEMLDVRQCVGLLEQARQPEGEAAYQAFMEIATSGFKKLRRTVKQKGHGVTSLDFQGFQDNGDEVYRVCAGALGLVMAEDLGVPIILDPVFYMLELMMKNRCDEMLTWPEEAEVTGEGREQYRRLTERYYCEDYGRCALGVMRDEFLEGNCGPVAGLVREKPEKDQAADEMLDACQEHYVVFSLFRLNPRMLQGACLSEKEAQQIFSIRPRMKWLEYLQLLLTATLCKYIRQMLDQCHPEVMLDQLGRMREEESRQDIFEGQMAKLRQQAQDLSKERDGLAEKLGQTEALLQKKQEQLEGEKTRREREKRELEALRNYVGQTAAEDTEGGDAGARNGISWDGAAWDGVAQSGMVCEPTAVYKTGAADPGHMPGHSRTEHSRTGSFRNEPSRAGSSRSARRKGGKSGRDGLKGRRVVVIGGHENWQRRFREYFPEWQFLPARKNNFDAGCIRNKEVIIVNTAVLKHSCYYRIISERSEEQTLLYVNGNNLDRCLEELEGQLEALGKHNC